MAGFVDLHAHFLPALDDGAKDIETGAAMVRGLNSKHYDRGPLARPDFEGAALDLARYYSRRMRGALAELPA